MAQQAEQQGHSMRRPRKPQPALTETDDYGYQRWMRVSTDLNVGQIEAGELLYPSVTINTPADQGVYSRAAARAAAYRRELRNLMKYIKSYTVILLMPYLYENGTAEAWQKLIEELGPMGYSVQDEESLELESSLASEFIYGGTQEVSEKFNERLKSGKSIAKLVLYQLPEMPEIVLPGPDEKDAEVLHVFLRYSDDTHSSNLTYILQLHNNVRVVDRRYLG